MPNFIELFIQTFVSPLLMLGLFIVVLFALVGADGVPIAKTLIALLVNIIVSIALWFIRTALTLLVLLCPALQPVLQPGSKDRRKTN